MTASTSALSSLAVNPVTEKVYVTSPFTNVVTVFGASGSSPQSLSVNAPLDDAATNQIYVLTLENQVIGIDGNSNAMTAYPAAVAASEIAVNPLTNKVYTFTGSFFSVLNIATGTHTNVVLPPGYNYNAGAVNPTTNKIYVAGALFNGSGSLIAVVDGVTNQITSLTAGGSGTQVVGVNPVTDKAYIANSGSNNMTVVDGAVNTRAAFLGAIPSASAVNPVTRILYTIDATGNSVAVYNAATGASTTVSVGSNPSAIALNSITNQIYVRNAGDNTITVIDGATNNATSISAGSYNFASTQFAMAVNPATNTIYIANFNDNSVTALSGATSTTTRIAVGTSPIALAIDEATNTIYVANSASSNLSAINGANNHVTTISTDEPLFALDVNPVTNTIYASSGDGLVVFVIDGKTKKQTGAVLAGLVPCAVAVNPITNMIYVPDISGNDLTIIDGATNATTTITTPHPMFAIGVNPTTNKIYAPIDTGGVLIIDGATNTTSFVSSREDGQQVSIDNINNQIFITEPDIAVEVFTEQQVQAVPLTTVITPLPGNQSLNPEAKFTLTTTSGFESKPAADAVLFQVDTWTGAWAAAAKNSNGSFTATTKALSHGLHTIFAYAADAQSGTSVNLDFQSAPLTGAITAYQFFY